MRHKNKPSAYTVLRSGSYRADAHALFQSLAGTRNDTLLLESAAGNGRNNTQSLLFIQNAVRLECRDRSVSIQALTVNGRGAIAALRPALQNLGAIREEGDDLTVDFRTTTDAPSASSAPAPMPADVIRLFAHGWNLGSDDAQKRLHLPGVLAYDHIDCLEALPPAQRDSHGFPDFVFYLPEIAVVVEHEARTAHVLIHGYHATSFDKRYAEDGRRADGLVDVIAGISPAAPRDVAAVLLSDWDAAVSVDIDDEEYAQLVDDIVAHITCGDVFQIVPSRTFGMPCRDAFRAYGVLRQRHPSPYLFYVQTPRFALFGAAPASSLRVYGQPPRVSMRPIAGTRYRGGGLRDEWDGDLDSRLEAELKLDARAVAAHMVLVDTARDDIARISRVGTRTVTSLLQMERYENAMHLVSVVEGELHPDRDALHALLASSNVGTLVGAPKIEAAKLLREREHDKRGPYGGAVGYLTSDGALDTATVERAVLVRDDQAYVRVGAAVLFDADGDAESAETRAQAMSLLRAVAAAEGGAS
ncbi:MAG: anthranilate synthase component 1 [Proteobacteria bacterium]|nr:anthranilate synthase component 1 [Pseudomonadota bacterium]